jgi:transcriptional regulator with XRE-family HTH domain
LGYFVNSKYKKEVIILNLKQLRKKFNLTQIELAEILGIAQSKVSRIEDNKLEMKVSELGKLLNALKLSAYDVESLIENQVNHAKPPRINQETK